MTTAFRAHGKKSAINPNDVLSEDEDYVRETTAQSYARLCDDWMRCSIPVALHHAMIPLKRMPGVGSVLASLILAVLDSHQIPFCSDYLYRWAAGNIEDSLWTKNGKDNQNLQAAWPQGGWNFPINWTQGEYDELSLRITEWRQRSYEHRAISCLDLEKAAYVLCCEDKFLTELESAYEPMPGGRIALIAFQRRLKNEKALGILNSSLNYTDKA